MPREFCRGCPGPMRMFKQFVQKIKVNPPQAPRPRPPPPFLLGGGVFTENPRGGGSSRRGGGARVRGVYGEFEGGGGGAEAPFTAKTSPFFGENAF